MYLIICCVIFQIGRVCVDNCQKFQGIDVEYQLEIVDRNTSVDLQSCFSAVGIGRSLRDVSGMLYVNDTEVLRRAECQELQYVVVATEQQLQLQARTQLLVIFEDECKSLSFSLFLCLDVLYVLQ